MFGSLSEQRVITSCWGHGGDYQSSFQAHSGGICCKSIRPPSFHFAGTEVVTVPCTDNYTQSSLDMLWKIRAMSSKDPLLALLQGSGVP